MRLAEYAAKTKAYDLYEIDWKTYLNETTNLVNEFFNEHIIPKRTETDKEE